MNIEILKQIEKNQAKKIANFLLERIEIDLCLKEKLETTNKTLKGCIEYVKSEAKKQAEDGMAWIEDITVWEWVVHYFLEDELDFEPKTPKTKAKNKTIKQSEDVENDEFEDEEDTVKQTKKVITLFGEENVDAKTKGQRLIKNSHKKDIKEKIAEQLSLFDFLYEN